MISDAAFVENHAERAGGGFFVDRMDMVDADWRLEETEQFEIHKGHFSSNFNCSNLTRNTVNPMGYGAHIATAVRSFYVILIYQNGTKQNVQTGASATIDDWRSGDALPVLQFVMMDHFMQGPSLTRAKNIKIFQENQTLETDFFGSYAKVIAESPNGLMENRLSSDASSGMGNMSIGAVLRKPGNYKLILWRGNNKLMNVSLKVTLRKCIIDEESALGGKLCAMCDSNHFNLDPESSDCKLCPTHCNCSSWGIAPMEKHWVPSPCFAKAFECLSAAACHYSIPLVYVSCSRG